MIRKYKFGLLSCIVGSIGILSCQKDWKTVSQVNYELKDSAFIKVMHTTLSGGTVALYANGRFLSYYLTQAGATAPNLFFPTLGAYATVTPGAANILLKDTLPVSKVSLVVTGTLEAGKYYSLFTYDTVTSIKYKLVEDKLTASPDTTTVTARIRIANFLANQPVGLDIISKRTGTVYATNVLPTNVSEFAPAFSRFTDSIQIRLNGTATIIGTINTVNMLERRNYTVLVRGRTGGTGVNVLAATFISHK